MSPDRQFDRRDPLIDALLAAGRQEAPSARVFERALQTVSSAASRQAAEAGPAQPESGHATSALARPRGASLIGTAGPLTKPIVVGLAAGLVALGIGHVWRSLASEPRRPARVAAPESRSAAPNQPAARALDPGPASAPGAHAAPAPEMPHPAVDDAADPSRARRTLGRGSPIAGRPGTLHEELRRVDAARRALDRAQPRTAVRETLHYERRFPAGRLLPEALLIRMTAWSQLNDRARARAAAERLIRTSPRSPHAAHARALLQGAANNP